MATRNKKHTPLTIDMLVGDRLDLIGVHKSDDGAQLLLTDGDHIIHFPCHEESDGVPKTLVIEVGNYDMQNSLTKRYGDWLYWEMPKSVCDREGFIIPDNVRSLARDYYQVAFAHDWEVKLTIPCRVLDAKA